MCIFEIVGLVMLIGGIIALIKGEVTLSKTKKVIGGRARIIGGVMLLPLPIVFMMGFIYGIISVAKGHDPEQGVAGLVALSAVVTLLTAGVAVALCLAWSE